MSKSYLRNYVELKRSMLARPRLESASLLQMPESVFANDFDYPKVTTHFPLDRIGVSGKIGRLRSFLE